MNKKPLGPVFWGESVLASATAFLAVLTLVWHDWIEGVFAVDPDHHGGSFEWELVVGLCLASVILSALARREWRRIPFALPS